LTVQSAKMRQGKGNERALDGHSNVERLDGDEDIRGQSSIHKGMFFIHFVFYGYRRLANSIYAFSSS